MVDKIHVLEIGTIPETIGIGGVTIHISRLFDWLYQDDEVDLVLFDYKKSFFTFKLFKLIKKSDLIHIHVNNPYLRIFYILLSKLLCRKTIITIHEEVGIYGNLKDDCVKLAIKICTVPIVLNKISYERIKGLNERTVIISAFIPEKKTDPLPPDVVRKIKYLKSRYKTLIATNSYRRVFTSENEETYGIEILIDFFRDKEYGLIISDPSGTYKEAIKDIPPNILIIPYPHSFYEVIKLSDIVIRNTATDGDALTVKEGLALGKHVLATDRVNRPEGVIKYKYNDFISLENALLSINKLRDKKRNLTTNAAFDLKELYKLIAHIE